MTGLAEWLVAHRTARVTLIAALFPLPLLSAISAALIVLTTSARGWRLATQDVAAAALLLMAEVSYRKEAYLPARAFLQRFEAVGPANAPSLSLGFRIESALGDADAAERYRRDLLSGFPESAEAAETRKLN